MIMKKLEAVIFDLDGVITDTAEQHYLAWKQLADELAIPFDRDFNENLKGVSRMASLEFILSRRDQSNDLTVEQKEALATKKNEHYKQLIKEITPKDLLPGMDKLLKDLKNEGIKIGLASASKNALTVVNQLEISDVFDVIVDAATVKRSKPDPEIFLRAAEEMSCPVETCIGIEDAEAGVEAIKGANMFAVGVGSKEAMYRADVRVEHTQDLSLAFLIEKFN
jgi:beta-phosphoglucomutase